MKQIVMIFVMVMGCVMGVMAQTAEDLIHRGLARKLPKFSKQYFVPAIKQGNTLAMTLYAMQHYLQYYGSPSYKKYKNYPSKTNALLNKANQKNEFWVLPMFGFCYEQGIGVSRDMQTAFMYFQKTDAQSDLFFAEIQPMFDDNIIEAKFKLMLFSQIHLAFCYENGLGVEKNSGMAKKLREKVINEIRKYRTNNDPAKTTDYIRQNIAENLTYQARGAEENFRFSVYDYDMKYTDKDMCRLEAYNEAKIWKNVVSYGYYQLAENASDCSSLVQAAENLKYKTNIDDKSIIFEYYKKAADMGCERAYHNLALCYQFGNGTSKDYKKAIEWYRKNGDSYPSLESIGEIYEKGGFGVAQNYDSAFFYYDAASMIRKKYNAINAEFTKKYNELKYKCSDVSRYSYSNVALASKSVAELRSDAEKAFLAKNYTEAALYFSKTAEKSGNSSDQFYAGLSYDILKNYQKAAYWYEKSANQGHADAKKELPRTLFNVGWSYDNSRDYTNAMTYYKKAWEKGSFADAATNIGWLYEYGRGVVQSNYTALSWYKKAMDAGSSHGKTNYYTLKQQMEAPTQTAQTTQQRTTNNGETLRKVGSAISEIGQGLSQIFGGGSNSNYNSESYSSGSYSGSSSSTSSSSGSGGVCTSCHGKKYESQSFEYAAASRAGVRQPYHHYGGSGCPYCKKSTEHYHYPCSHCLGTGKE